MKKWKKGDKVVRLYGKQAGMKSGDVGTLKKNQKYPGVVFLEEFNEYGEGHDPIRLIRLKDYPNLHPDFIVAVHDAVKNNDLSDILSGFDISLKKRNRR